MARLVLFLVKVTFFNLNGLRLTSSVSSPSIALCTTDSKSSSVSLSATALAPTLFPDQVRLVFRSRWTFPTPLGHRPYLRPFFISLALLVVFFNKTSLIIAHRWE